MEENQDEITREIRNINAPGKNYDEVYSQI